MKQLFSILAIGAALVLSAPTNAQSPATFAADPGPVVTGANGVTLPVGWESTLLFNIQPLISSAASMVVGPNGDLFFTETVGGGCNPASTTQIYRVPMNGGVPVQPFSIVPFTTVAIDAHELVFEPITNALYACGTCDQTGSVYRIPASGVPELLNPSTPLNDPDGLTVGVLPGRPGPQLLVTTQDGLFAFDLVSGPTPLLNQVVVDLTNVPATTLGNWGFPVFDPKTNTLLAGNVGRPLTRTTVELTFTSPTSCVAAVVGPDNLHPMTVDHQGVRWWRQVSEIGLVNPGNVFLPVVSTQGSYTRLAYAFEGNFFFADVTTGDVLRLDRPFTMDALTVSSSAGGIVGLNIDAPAPRGNEGYLVVCSISGSSPGTPWGATTAPINYDIITQVALFLTQFNDPAVTNWKGLLDANGRATAEMRFYPGLIPAGVTFNLCFIAGNPEYSANAAWVHVLP